MTQLIKNGINSLADFIEETLTTYAGNPAFSCLGQTLSFADVDEKSKAFAAWLQHESGLKEGDRIVIQLPNLVQYPIAVYGAMRAGLVVVNTNPLYTPNEMRHQFNDSGATAIVILSDLLPKLDEIKSETSINTVISTGAADLLTNQSEATTSDITLLQAIEKGRSLSLKPRSAIQLDDTCVLQYTGGTTGVSKGAELTHRNILSNAAQTKMLLGDKCGEGTETFICPLPLYHIYAFTVNMVTMFSSGNLNVLVPNPRDMDGFISAIKPFKFTAFSGINTLFVGLCMTPVFRELDFSNLHLTISGGSALTSDAVNMWEEVTNCSISEGYGLSETSPVLCLNKPANEELGTVGKPLVDTDIQIWDDNDQPVDPGQEGQIVAKGPQVMKGYWNRPDETEKVMSNGYFKTGDIGKIVESGCVKIVDRLKDMIIVSGFNVYPNEVEEVLSRHPNIIEAAVVGKPDEKSGECVCAFIVVNENLSIEDVIAHCRKDLTAYKVPKQVNFMEELPKSTVGKILRRELR